MKNTVITIFCLISFCTIAQKWSLFQPNQGSYYNLNRRNNLGFEDYGEVRYWNIDSTKSAVNEEVWYINSQFLPDEYQSCLSENSDFYSNTYSIDSLWNRNDTIFYKGESLKNLFFFLPKAKVGESWYIKRGGEIDLIKITFEEATTGKFLGIEDSIRHYSYEAVGVHQDSTNLDEHKMRLSKHYGLIEYVDFVQLANPNYINDYFKAVELIGIETDSLRVGYEPISLETFLPYATNDVLFWSQYYRKAFSPEGWIKFHLDTITRVVANEDSLYYTYNRTSFNNQNIITSQETELIQSFVFDDFRNIVEQKPNLWAYGNGTITFHNNLALNIGRLYIWNYVNHLIDPQNKTVVTVRSAYFDNKIDTTTCLTESNGISHWLRFDEKKGLVRFEKDYFDQSIEGFRLIGSKINGEEQGTFEIIVNTEDISIASSKIHIFPNPANQYIFINTASPLAEATYHTHDLNGRLVNSGILNDSKIRIQNLKSGIYFLNITTNQASYTYKFVKQAF